MCRFSYAQVIPGGELNLSPSDQDTTQTRRSLKAKSCGWSCKRIIAHVTQCCIRRFPVKQNPWKTHRSYPTRERARLCRCATLRGLQSQITTQDTLDLAHASLTLPLPAAWCRGHKSSGARMDQGWEKKLILPILPSLLPMTDRELTGEGKSGAKLSTE